MNEQDKSVLRALGWTDELLELAKPTRETEAVDRMFLDNARKALAAGKCTALAFLAAHPGVSILDLARELNRGVSAIGLVMAIYDEAKQENLVREVAKDLLIRRVREECPEGWSSDPNVHPAVTIGGWEYEIKRYVADAVVASYASDIVRHITVDNPPPSGWKPASQGDKLIESVFDRYWPAGPKRIA